MEISCPWDENNDSAVIEKEDPRFTEIIQHLKECISGSVTRKTRVTIEDGVTKTAHLTIPYAYGHFLDFEL